MVSFIALYRKYHDIWL